MARMEPRTGAVGGAEFAAGPEDTAGVSAGKAVAF